MREFRKHRYLSITQSDNIKLFLANQFGSLFCFKSWNKRKQLQKLYEKAQERLEKRLDIVKFNKKLTDMRVLLKSVYHLLDKETIFSVRHTKKHFINIDDSSEDGDCDVEEVNDDIAEIMIEAKGARNSKMFNSILGSQMNQNTASVANVPNKNFVVPNAAEKAAVDNF